MEPPGTLDLESLQKKVEFDHANDIDLSRGGVYDPNAVDDLISWLEGNHRQEVVVHQLADQVGNLCPGQYITPKLMFSPHTLPGGSWHKFILEKIWGAIRGFREVLSTIFGLFVVGRIIWYLVKVIMDCGYIHSANGSSPQLAWSFCTEVLFTHHYQKSQHRQQPAAVSSQSDNDPSSHPCKRRTISEHVMSVASCSCLDPCQPLDSNEELRSTPECHATREETSRFLRDCLQRLEARQADRVASSQGVRAASTPFGTLDRAPPPYVTPPGVGFLCLSFVPLAKKT